ncbi:uncharacterized protein BYT42DRAFT_582752 [Radiomyces spectabilis]|uniref:uncharacterized protein n=1 Tax=Radiomyces spectabilis TaxID=64574 RepID=UPI00221E3FD2|nr:uncharacterized protein BYT42DRAFT_582752 [Radiomyces spectabilis]KAI8370530.1 hypothetical protein BYT42DRAFT_582752 [Radiomyces spectabilis]
MANCRRSIKSHAMTSNAQQKAFIQDYSKSHASCCENEDDIEKHIIENHLTDIFDVIVKPAFAQQTHHALIKRPKGRYTDPVKDSEIPMEQKWKHSKNGYCAADIVEWCMLAVPSNTANDLFRKVAPIILIILDDYDLEFKRQGVKIFHCVLKNVDAAQLVNSGLDQVFFQALIQCLPHVTDERGVELIRVAYPCVMDLVSLTRAEKSKERLTMFEKIMTEGIIVGLMYAGHKIKVLPILLQPIARLYKELRAIGVRYLKITLLAIGDALMIHPNQNFASEKLDEDIVRLHESAIAALAEVIRQCWPRILHYRGSILKALANAWLNYYDSQDENAATIRDGLKTTYQLFALACEGKQKVRHQYLSFLNGV